ncbi:MAG: Na+/H+ antiporter subunit E [Hyphomonadaceae bacterium]
MVYLIGLVAALTAFWMGMSGHYSTLMLSLAGVSILVTLILTLRLTGFDRESSPYVRFISLPIYWVWLIWEIAKANWIVIRACLRADLDINPALVKVKTTCRSDLAKTVFANSITLTPGTVTIDVDGDVLLVHGLYEDDAQPENFALMDRLSARATDGKGGGT